MTLNTLERDAQDATQLSFQKGAQNVRDTNKAIVITSESTWIMIKVTAGIVEKDGKLLIAKRKSGKSIESLWEFPGGKLEEGESLEECLKRELMEELNIEVKVDSYLCSSFFNHKGKEMELLAYRASYVAGELKMFDHDDIRWVNPSEFNNYEFIEPDKVIIRKLVKETSAIQQK